MTLLISATVNAVLLACAGAVSASSKPPLSKGNSVSAAQAFPSSAASPDEHVFEEEDWWNPTDARKVDHTLQTAAHTRTRPSEGIVACQAKQAEYGVQIMLKVKLCQKYKGQLYVGTMELSNIVQLERLLP